MRRFDSPDPLDPAAAPSRPARRRPAQASRAAAREPSNRLSSCVYPSWAGPPARSAAATDFAASAAFSAGAGLALLDQILRAAPPFAGALRQRLALRAAAASAAALRLREDQAALRDAEHLAASVGETSPAGRLHRLWRALAERPATLDAAARVELPPDLDWAALAGALQAAAAMAGAALARALPTTRRAEAEILAWWATDVALAERLGWERPVPLAAATLLRPELRGASSRRPRPGDPEWPDALAGAVALAARDAMGLAAELARGADRLLAAAPKLRAKGAGRVVELLLADDAVSPARPRRAPAVRSTRRARRRARIVGPPEFSPLRPLSGPPMSRQRRAGPDATFDPDLADLPEPMRWREWMGRVEAAIFCARDPVPRETLARLVGPGCNLDDLLADIAGELRGRPYDIVFVAGGWQFRTRPRFAGAIRAAEAGALRDGGAPELTPTELLALTAIAYLQPATRAELSRLAGREISRDIIGRLKRLDLIDGALRAPEPGAPFAYVTTRKFLAAFGLAGLRELPDLERLEDEGLLRRQTTDGDLDGILGLACDEERETDEDAADLDQGSESGSSG